MGSSPISGRGFFWPGLCLLPRAPYQELQEAFALLRPPLSRTTPLDARCRVPLAVRWVDPGSTSGGCLRRLSPGTRLAPVPPTPLSWGRSPRTRAGPRPWKSARLRALPVAPFERDARARPTHPDDWKTPPAFLARSLPFASSPIISGNFRGLRLVFGLPLAKAHAVPCSPWTGRPRRAFFSGGSSSSDAFGARSCCIRALRTRVGPGKPAEKSARLRALPVAPLSETPRAPGLTPCLGFFMGHPIRLETPLAFMRRTRFWIPVTSSANAALDTRLVLLRRAT